MIGTTKGLVYQMTLTLNNSVLINLELKYEGDSKSAMQSMSGDKLTGNLMVGCDTGYLHLLKLDQKKPPLVVKTHGSMQKQNTNSIACLANPSAKKTNYFVVGLQNGLVKIFESASGDHLVDIQAHSRSINAIAAHPSKLSFATVGDDTFVNVWKVQVEEGSEDISDIKLAKSQIVSNQLLIGVQWVGENCDGLLVTPYDYKFIVHFDRIPSV
mmetsp:Transcript_17454/g.29373  ORF Transcript_17454/g.29373 Transcript_17454/m.29373 type:complete len:213 (-) Transcript_17454:58-696(-)